MNEGDLKSCKKKAYGLPSRKWILWAGLVISIGLPLLLSSMPLLDYFNGKIYDVFSLQAAPGRRSDRIVIVDVDEKSLQEHGQWPWPRYKIAALLEMLGQGGAAAIGMDIMFPERDRTSLSSIRKDLGHHQNVSIVFDENGACPDNDRRLAEVISASPVVLGYQFLFDPPDAPRDCRLHPLRYIGLNFIMGADPFPWRATHVICNLPSLSERAERSGFFNVSPDSDGILRSVPLVIGYREQLYPSLALASVMKALRLEQITLRRRIDDYILELGGTEIPLNVNGALLVRYRGKGRTYTYISAADLLSGRIPESRIKDKIVFVGTSAAGLKEFRATPTDPLFPGVELHATVADNLLSGDFLSRPASAPGLEMMAAVLAGLIFVFTTRKTRAVHSFFLYVTVSAGLVVIAFQLFEAKGVYFSPVPAVIVLTADFGLLNVLKFRREEFKTREKTRDVALAQAAIIEGMAALTETRDPETGGHIKRTQAYVRILADALRQDSEFETVLTEEMVDLLYRTAPLHDIGKVGVSDRILLKPEGLTDGETAEMQRHARIGKDILAGIRKRLGNKDFLDIAQDITYTHHEKWDGTGYPQGLKGEQIPLAGRLMAVVDMYDALTSRRVYKAAISHEQAIHVMRDCAAATFDPRIFRVFLRINDEFRKVSIKWGDDAVSQ